MTTPNPTYIKKLQTELNKMEQKLECITSDLDSIEYELNQAKQSCVKARFDLDASRKAVLKLSMTIDEWQCDVDPKVSSKIDAASICVVNSLNILAAKGAEVERVRERRECILCDQGITLSFVNLIKNQLKEQTIHSN
jgi:hypothetical protein